MEGRGESSAMMNSTDLTMPSVGFDWVRTWSQQKAFVLISREIYLDT